jgi:hypothetical protein
MKKEGAALRNGLILVGTAIALLVIVALLARQFA